MSTEGIKYKEQTNIVGFNQRGYIEKIGLRLDL